MKLGYRDRIILLVVLVVVIFGIGIFVFIKPQWEKLSKNKDALKKAQNEWNTQLTQFDDINVIRKNINTRYEEALKISEGFTVEMDSVELDHFLQDTFMNTAEHKKNGVSLVSSLTVTNETTSQMAYYYYTPDVVTYPLYEYADFDGSLALEALKKRFESIVLAARGAQTVGNGSSQLTLLIHRKDTMKLIDAVHDYAVKNNDALLIQSIQITDYDELNKKPLERDAEGKVLNPPPVNPNDKNAIPPEEIGYSEIVFDFQVYYMQEPTKPNVGTEYDKTIWDTNKWETYVSE